MQMFPSLLKKENGFGRDVAVDHKSCYPLSSADFLQIVCIGAAQKKFISSKVRQFIRQEL